MYTCPGILRDRSYHRVPGGEQKHESAHSTMPCRAATHPAREGKERKAPPIPPTPRLTAGPGYQKLRPHMHPADQGWWRNDPRRVHMVLVTDLVGQFLGALGWQVRSGGLQDGGGVGATEQRWP